MSQDFETLKEYLDYYFSSSNFPISKDVLSFLYDNNIELNNLPESFNITITGKDKVESLSDPEFILTMQNKIYDYGTLKNVSFKDIVGTYRVDKNFNFLEFFSFLYNESSIYGARNLEKLKINLTENIENILKSLKKDKNNLYLFKNSLGLFTNRDGNHRIFYLLMSYFIEKEKYKDNPELEQQIENKYVMQFFVKQKSNYKFIDDISMCISDITSDIHFDFNYLNNKYLGILKIKNQTFIIDSEKSFVEHFNKYLNSLPKNSDMFKEIIKRLSDINYFENIKNDSFYCEKKDDILDSYDEETLNEIVQMIPFCSIDVLNEFFLHDKRAFLIIDKIDIYSYIRRGLKINSDIVKSKYFFELIKPTNMESVNVSKFRTIINMLQINCELDPLYFENLVSNYYESEIIMRKYIIENINRELLSIKNDLALYLKESLPDDSFIDDYIENLLYTNEYFLEENHTTDEQEKYIAASAFVNKFKYIIYNNNAKYEDVEKIRYKILRLQSIFRTKRKNEKIISDMIIDDLFKTSYRNVAINISEILNYNEYLGSSERTITIDDKELYNKILSFKNLSLEDKCSLHEMLKNRNISFKLYDDISSTKNVAYKKIKESLFNPSINGNYSNSLSSIYKTVVYDERETKYSMLVRAIEEPFNPNYNKNYRECNTIITEEDNSNFKESGFLYGYNTFDEECVLGMNYKDVFSSDIKEDMTGPVNQLIRPHVPIFEVQIKTKKYENGSFLPRTPDYLVAINNISEKEVEESKRLNIPIVLIKENFKDLGADNNYITCESSYGLDYDVENPNKENASIRVK